MNQHHNLDWQEILLKIQSHCTSETAKIEISKIAPLKSADAALRKFEEISSATLILSSGIRPFMSSLDFFHSWALRVKKKSVLKTIEIKDVRSFCLETLAYREALSLNSQDPWSYDKHLLLFNPENILEDIDQVITPSGEIRSDASENLFRLFKERDRLAKDVHTTMDRLVRDHDMENVVQDKYVTTREGRWVVPVKSGMQHHLPGVIHGSSQSKQTVFMEPETVIPMNNRLRQIEVDIEEEIEKILTELSQEISKFSDEIHLAAEILIEGDVLLAKAQFSRKIQALPCEFSSEEFILNDVRHPLLAMTGQPVVANTVQFSNTKKILLLSGPNAGGKTVLLKSMGLAAQMARCGLPICTGATSKIPFFKNLLIGIGDFQSVDENLSTFAAHLKILSEAAEYKGNDSLILIDEICGSTDPEEGSALARSFIETFSKNSIYGIITSHLGPLKTGWTPESAVLNGSLEYDSKTGRPTYQFIPGIAGDSLALLTAKRVGVKAEILERSMEILSPATQARMRALDEIENMKHEIHSLQTQLKQDLHKAQQTKKKYEDLLKQFLKEKENDLAKTLKKAERKVDEAIALAKAEQVFKKHSSLQEIKFQLPEIIKAKKENSTNNELLTSEDFAKKFPPGSKVFVPTIQQDGIVQSQPNAKGEVMILSNSLRLQISWKELRLADSPSNPTAKLVRQAGGRVQIALSDEERTLDLRGKTVNEALEELEIALDKSSHQKEDRIKIIHGHGTEALKKAVRSYLSRSIYVKKWKSGTPESGGDGLTWVELGEN